MNKEEVRSIVSKWIDERPWSYNNLFQNAYQPRIESVLSCPINKYAENAVYAKRSGNYDEALNMYIKLMSTFEKEAGVICVGDARGLFKVLVCLNYFDIAFDLVSNIFSGMGNSLMVDRREGEAFQNYTTALIALSMDVVDDGDFSKVLPFAANYSGNYNYELQRNASEIKEDLKSIREKARRKYNI